MTLLLCCVFALSGFAALVFESLWFHQAGLALGNSVWASSLILAGFMGGVALGNGLAGRLGPRLTRPARTYAALELLIATSGVAIVHLLPFTIPLLESALRPVAGAPWASNALRLCVAFVLLLLPATAMGATLPVLVGPMYRRDPNFGRVLGRLYGWNTLGAVVGAVLGPTALVGSLGVRGASFAAAAANLAAGALVITCVRDAPMSGARSEPQQPDPKGRWLLAASAVCGACLLGLEVVWFRALSLFEHATTTAFAVMLALVLVGIGAGGLLGAAIIGRAPRAAERLGWIALGAGAVVIAGYLALPSWVTDATSGDRRLLLLCAGILMVPTSTLSGVLFTLLGHALHAAGWGETRAAGWLTLANTSGSMLGSLLAGLVLLPAVGIDAALRILAGGYAVAAVLVHVALARPTGLRLPVAAGSFALGILLLPADTLTQQYVRGAVARASDARPFEAVALREGLTETSVLLRQTLFGETLEHRLVTNSISMSGTGIQALRYMRLFVYWPIAVHPEPRRALLISYGVGTTAKALTDSAELETIDVVDTSRDILALDEQIFEAPRTSPLDDPRVRVHVEDGRHFLRLTRDRYDLITGEPPPPKMAGIVSLYTQEFFELARSRLNPGGILTYWLPVHGLFEPDALAIVRAFCNVFPDCSLWNGARWDWMLVGTNDLQEPVSAERFRRQWEDPVVGPQLRSVGLELPEQLGALFMADAGMLQERVGGAEPLTDDFPRRLPDAVASYERMQQAFDPWRDVQRASEGFRASEWIARLWPPELREGHGCLLRDPGHDQPGPGSGRARARPRDPSARPAARRDPLDHAASVAARRRRHPAGGRHAGVGGWAGRCRDRGDVRRSRPRASQLRRGGSALRCGWRAERQARAGRACSRSTPWPRRVASIAPRREPTSSTGRVRASPGS